MENLKYITTSSYGRIIKTVPNPETDKKFLEQFISVFKPIKQKFLVDDLLVSSKTRLMECFEQVLGTVVSVPGEFNLFSQSKDQLGREMRRYIVDSKTNGWKFVIDFHAAIDIRLSISSVRRFVLTHIPRSWSHVDAKNIIPAVQYVVKVWNTPVSYYTFVLFEFPLDVEFTYKVERARELAGLPIYYAPKEFKSYERIDYDIRRAIFNEVADVLQEGTT